MRAHRLISGSPIFGTLSGRDSRGILARLWQGMALRQQRRALARLDAAQLRDIGRTHDEAQAEARRPVWDVPAHWRL